MVQTMLSEKKSLLHKVARTLLEKETIEGNELRELISNHSNESDEHEAH
jgi:ATP-dependent Zn protease